jgi:hypothetical protein
METNSDEAYGLVATFDPSGSWGRLLTDVAWLRGQRFGDVLMVAQQHEEHIATGLREAHEPFPRVLGTIGQWNQAGWTLLDGVLGYHSLDRSGRPSAWLFSLAEVAPISPADDAMYDSAEPASLVGAQTLRQRVWNDLSGQLERLGYDFSYTFDADQAHTVVDHHGRAVRMPAWKPFSQRVADLAHVVTGAALQPAMDRAHDSLRNALSVITSSAAHIVMTTTGLDPSTVIFPTRQLAVAPDPDHATRLVLTIGESARRTANQVLTGISTPLRHDGTTTPPGHQHVAEAPRREAPEQPSTARRRQTSASRPELGL